MLFIIEKHWKHGIVLAKIGGSALMAIGATVTVQAGALRREVPYRCQALLGQADCKSEKKISAASVESIIGPICGTDARAARRRPLHSTPGRVNGGAGRDSRT